MHQWSVEWMVSHHDFVIVRVDEGQVCKRHEGDETDSSTCMQRSLSCTMCNEETTAGTESCLTTYKCTSQRSLADYMHPAVTSEAVVSKLQTQPSYSQAICSMHTINRA